MSILPSSGTLKSQAMEVCWLTDPGCVRPNNEDAWAVLPEQGLVLVSDGMGGEAAGEVASRRVAEWLPPLVAERLDRTDESDPRAVEAAIADAVRALNRRVRSEASSLEGVAKMGATLTMLLYPRPRAYIGHIGDSSAYLLRGSRLSRLTRDHSVVGGLIERGIIEPDQASGHPMRGQLGRYVGMAGNPVPDVSRIRPRQGDLLLLCTDGLTDEVADEDLRQILLDAAGLQPACQALVDAANRAGGGDNITAVLVRMHP